jgi:hypothetical protein
MLLRPQALSKTLKKTKLRVRRQDLMNHINFSI